MNLGRNEDSFWEKTGYPQKATTCSHSELSNYPIKHEKVMDYVERFRQWIKVIPIKTDDHLIMVKIDDIIYRIDRIKLTIYTTDKTFTVRMLWQIFNIS